MSRKPEGELRRGWTTGACATAATKAAYQALLTGEFPDPVAITLPRGEQPAFALAIEELVDGVARAGIIKDAGDDPDVTHLALVRVEVRRGKPGTGIQFFAGPGVGTVTKPGLPLSVGEPAINPVPRALMSAVVEELAKRHGDAGDVQIEVGVQNGEELAHHTWNGRLGIVGGLSILGTTGIVVPYSCSAWIHSIHRGIDVARATGLDHVAGCTGSTSERVVQEHFGLPVEAMLDMGDFAGGLLKYLRRNPVPLLTIGGGFGKLCKLARGHLDLHSGRSQVDFDWLSDVVRELAPQTSIIEAVRSANTANEVLALAIGSGVLLADEIASRARAEVIRTLQGEAIAVDVMIINRAGEQVAHMSVPDRILVLGGTVEARHLANRLGAQADVQCIYSLAGTTRHPETPSCETRVGGFGGEAGLIAYLKQQNIAAVVDATHPFAATMSGHAYAACVQAGVPRVVYVRPPWTPTEHDRWTIVSTMADAAMQLQAFSQRPLLTVGSRDLAAFTGLHSIRCLVRSIEKPAHAHAKHFEWLPGRGPFSVEDETELLRTQSIDCVVSKNSGGNATSAKLVAARELAVRVIMCERPTPPEGLLVEDEDAVAAWIANGFTSQEHRFA